KQEKNKTKIYLVKTQLNKTIQDTFLVRSMTGESDLAEKININLAIASEDKGWAIGLGSTRALLESDAHKESFLIRKEAKSVPLIANLGAVQFNYGYGVEACQQIVDKT